MESAVVNIETHVLDYEGELYGKKIQIGFLKKLRDQRKFSDVEALKNQLIRDENDARKLVPLYEKDFLVCNKYIYNL